MSEEPPTEPPPEPDIKPPGLPSAVDWTFNFDATWGTFGFAHSLYDNPKPDPALAAISSDNWSGVDQACDQWGIHAR